MASSIWSIFSGIAWYAKSRLFNFTFVKYTIKISQVDTMLDLKNQFILLWCEVLIEKKQ
jgi:hypothetical protein